MKILALVHRVPFPPDKGEKIRAYHELRHLAARGHTIDLATFADTAADTTWRPQLLELCRDVAIVPLNRHVARARALLALGKDRPLSVEYFGSFWLRARVRRWLAERSYDVAFCYSSPMAELVRDAELGELRLPRVMDFVDVDSDKWRQYAAHTGGLAGLVHRREARTLERYERALAAELEASVFVSPAEAELFRRIAPEAKRVVTVPNGVDAEHFGATVRQPQHLLRPVLVFVGQMDYRANVDAVTWFADEIFPRVRRGIPDAELHVVGRAPVREVRALGARPGVTVTGAVPDVRPHLARATVMVAPLRIARGIQNKVLEGMAARVPIVLTSRALEGLDAEPGRHVLVADEPQAFADAVLASCRDPARAAERAA
ncbi:TIGR03087 family PEP-CTERM/XrtA system glycosyltransferase, partial [Myxococcota bacterium]|nr:TIGR03087 family PEP-CTERM/XrtA system glycosyltransferase [Myxococcota bacterium]